MFAHYGVSDLPRVPGKLKSSTKRFQCPAMIIAMPIRRMAKIGSLRKTAAATITHTYCSVRIACAKLCARRCSTSEYSRNAKPKQARPGQGLELGYTVKHAARGAA